MPDVNAIAADIPNGMETHYAFDAGHRLTKIEHRDGAAVLEGFGYALTPGGGISRITHEDGAFWDYENDGRGRLTQAERYDTDGTTLLHRYSYTYDDGDNRLTKAVLDAVASVTTATAFAYNDANELVSQSVGGVTTSFAYDAWGRMTSKSDGTYSAAYAYRYGNKLYSVTSDFPSEGNAAYQYDGAGKRRQRTAGGVTTKYRWDLGWTVLNEEDGNGNLTRTYVGRSTAHVDGTNPSTGTWRFYVHDHLGSTRGVYDTNNTQYAAFEHTPYGELYASSGSVGDITRRYTGHDWDDAAGLYYAPYRYYAPGLARWITRDPLGMVDGPNVYGYVRGNPVRYFDPIGTASRDGLTEEMTALLDCIEKEIGAVNVSSGKRPNDTGGPHEKGDAMDISTRGSSPNACQIAKAVRSCADEQGLKRLRVCQNTATGHIHVDNLEGTVNPRTGRRRSADCSLWPGYEHPPECECN